MRTQIIDKSVVVSAIEGNVEIVLADGSSRPLQKGEILQPGAKLTIADDAKLALSPYDDTPASDVPAGSESAEPAQPQVAASQEGEPSDIAALQESILQGVDPTQNFEASAAGGAPAAGGGGGIGGVAGASGNGGFVTIDRTGDATIAAAGFDTTYDTAAVINENQAEDLILENQLDDLGETAVTLEDTQVSGNLLDNSTNPDGPADASIVSYDWGINIGVLAGVAATITGVGTLIINPNGSYTFTPAPNYDGAVPPVNYQVTDGQDTVTSTLVVSITPVDEEVGLAGLAREGGEVQVSDTNLADGSDPNAAALTQSGVFTFNAPDGVQSLTLAGVTLITNGQLGASFPQSIISPLGNALTITAVTYNPVTGAGQVSYSYTLGDNENHTRPVNDTSLSESFSVVLIDSDGDTASDTLDVTILDDTLTLAGGEEQFVRGLVHEDALPSGNSEGSDQSVSATGLAGTLNALVNFGADGAGSFGLGSDVSSLVGQGLTSGGVALSYSVAGNVLTASAGGVPIFTLTVGAGGSYSFTLSGQLDHPTADGDDGEQLAGVGIDFSGVLAATDGDGDPLTGGFPAGSFAINVEDDVPTATNDEGGSVTEDAAGSLSGNVLGNDTSGADRPAVFVGWSATGHDNSAAVSALATYGTFTQNPTTGAWSFALDNSRAATQALTSSFNQSYDVWYTMKDADGDESIAKLTISIKGADDSASVVTAAASGPDHQVFEASLNPDGSNAEAATETTTGSFAVSASDGILSVVIGGTSYTLAQLQGFNGSQTVNTGEGVLTLLGYSGTASSGTVSYSYTLSATIDNDSKEGATLTEFDDSVTITVNGVGGTSASDQLVVRIVDDTPSAIDDAGGAVTEDVAGSLSGNVLGNDTSGADRPAVFVGWSATGHDNSAAVSALATYGTFTQNPTTGAWSFALDNSRAATQALTSSFNQSYDVWYTMKDADGDESIAKLTISIKGADDSASVVTAAASGPDHQVFEASLNPDGSNAEAATETTTGSFAVSASDGILSVVIGGTSYTLAQLQGFNGSQTVNTGEGVLTLLGYSGTASSGTVSYSYTLSATIDNDSKEGATLTEFDDSVTITVNGVGGTSASDQLVVRIVDDVPVALNDAPACIIQSPLPLVNVTLVLDTSGSMKGDKLAALKSAVINLAQAYAGLDAPIHVNLVTFATGSSNVGDYNFNSVSDSGYINLISAVNALSADGWTNYAEALNTAKAQILLDVNNVGADKAQQNKLYFISDGNPEPDPTGQVSAITAWQTFITNGDVDNDNNSETNPFQAHAIGINVNTGTYLNPISSSGTYILASPGNLSATLVDLASAGGGVIGNVLANDNSGADGVGLIASVSVGAQTFTINASGTDIDILGTGGVTHSFDKDTKVLSLNTELGILKIDLQGTHVGEYSFVAKTNLSPAIFGDDGAVKQLFTYTLVDGDGDKAPANLEICIRSNQSVLVVGHNVSDIDSSLVAHHIASPFDSVTGGVIQGVAGNDVLIGDVGGSTRLPGQKANIVYVLDNSGSMDSTIPFTNIQGVTTNISRLDALKQSVIASLNNLYESGASDIKVHLVKFGTNAPVGSTFTLTANGIDHFEQLNNAIAFVNAIMANGGYTNYEAGLVQANNWIQSSAPVLAADVNKVLFVSDGVPNRALDNSGSVISADAQTAIKHVLGTAGNNDNVSEVGLIETAGPGTAQAFTIEAVGINVSASAQALLNDVEGSGGLADNVITANQLMGIIGNIAGGLINVAVVGNDALRGGDGNDILFGDSIYADSIDGGWASFAAAHPGATDSELRALIAAGHISFGQDGSVGGNDLLDGGAGDDTLYGQKGDDLLIGGAGSDTLRGGSGKDTFRWMAGDADGGIDRITDFAKGSDGDILDISAVLDVSTGASANTLATYLNFTFDSANNRTVLTIDSNGLTGGSQVNQTVYFDGVDLTGGSTNQQDIINSLLTNLKVDP